MELIEARETKSGLGVGAGGILAQGVKLDNGRVLVIWMPNLLAPVVRGALTYDEFLVDARTVGECDVVLKPIKWQPKFEIGREVSIDRFARGEKP